MNLKSALRRFILEGQNQNQSTTTITITTTKIMTNLPCALIIKEPICPLLEFLCDCLGFLMSLEPSLVLLVEPPALVLERFGREKLLVRALSVIKQVEQRIGVDPPRIIQPRIVEDGQWLLRVVDGCVIRALRLVMTRLLGVRRFRTGCERRGQESLR